MWSSLETAGAEKLWLGHHVRGMDLLLQKINLHVKVAQGRLSRMEAESDPDDPFMMSVIIQATVDLGGLQLAQKRNQDKFDALANEHLIWDLGHHETLPRKLTDLEIAWVATFREAQRGVTPRPAASATTTTTASQLPPGVALGPHELSVPMFTWRTPPGNS
jgi:hypothetical protein